MLVTVKKLFYKQRVNEDSTGLVDPGQYQALGLEYDSVLYYQKKLAGGHSAKQILNSTMNSTVVGCIKVIFTAQFIIEYPVQCVMHVGVRGQHCVELPTVPLNDCVLCVTLDKGCHLFCQGALLCHFRAAAGCMQGGPQRLCVMISLT